MRSRHGAYFARRGGIAKRFRRRTVCWQKTKDGLFVVCPGCGRINEVPNPEVYRGGRLTDCVHCHTCGAHPFIILEGWKGRTFIWCDECGKRLHPRGDFNRVPKGWKAVSESGHCLKQCCRTHLCPRCAREEEGHS